MTRIYDCFPFFNETELLKFRINYLKDTVDHFVIVEADTTYSGLPKQQNFSYGLFDEDTRRKIRYYYITFTEEAFVNDTFHLTSGEYKEAFQREEYQRDYLINGLFDAESEDIILLTDIDEIPNKHKLNRLLAVLLVEYPVLALEMHHFHGSILNKTHVMNEPKLVTYKNLRNRLTFIRRSPQTRRVIKDAGWHFSYFGGEERVKVKIRSEAHLEHNTEENRKLIIGDLKNRGVEYPLDNLPPLIFSPEYRNFFLPEDEAAPRFDVIPKQPGKS
jgi:beta-1,4-mannosyl-glycoprotein beta-1,4-N-acetylglucosaminyltransferase